MPRKKQPPRLYWHPKDRTWIIRDGSVFKRTGYGQGETELAEKELEEYLADKWTPKPKGKRPSDIDCGTVIMLYVEAKAPTLSGRNLNNMLTTCERLNNFWGDKAVNQIIGPTCREFVARSGTPSTARRDLQILKASVNLYANEHGLDFTPGYSLPPKEEARTEYMTRSDAARMLWNAYRHGPKHLVRYLIVGLYSGSRSEVITDMQWMPNTTGGYFDLERGVMYRSAPGVRETNKRKRPAVIPNRLMFWLKRWHRQDVTKEGYISHVIHYHGKPVKSLKKTWGRMRKMSALSDKIVPHTMRHSSITWAMQDGRSKEVVCSYYNVSLAVLEGVYWHHHPEFQSEMKGVF